jgi:probable phosphomutase (TIGR03848 family)
MATLLLIRHAENDFLGRRLAGRLPGVHLNAAGCQHAEQLAEALRNLPIKAIYASPLERTMETAEPLAQALSLAILPRAGLQEIHFGGWQGKTMKQMARMKLWKTVQEAPSQMTFPGGESFPEAQARVAAELTAINAGHADEDLVACFSHSDAIKLAVAYFLGMPLDNFQRTSIDPCSITMLHLPKEGAPHLSSINQRMGLVFKQPEEKKPRRKPKDEKQA